MEIKEFERLLNADKESEHLEFKEAKEQLNFDNGKKSLYGYYVAIANEKGGKLILGVSDKIPRKIVGTSAFKNFEKIQEKIYNKFRRGIDIEEIIYNDKRVLVFSIPSRPIGEALDLDGQFLMRQGEKLMPMSPEIHKKISQEATQDFSSEICEKSSFEDLDETNIRKLRKLLSQSKKTEKSIEKYSDLQLLTDLGLIRNSKITNAALILLGREKSLQEFFPHSEIRYKYKKDENQIKGDSTKIFKGGYIGYYNNLWGTIDARNDEIHLQVGLRVLKKQTFEEETIREAINNAIIHRDYTEIGSIIINQSPKKLSIENPGGLLPGITIENIVDETKTRNKLLAEVLSKCDFVESFGNGVDIMIQNQISTGKKSPDYTKTTKYKVSLEIDGEIYDQKFATYVSRIAIEKNKDLGYRELITLVKIKNNEKVPHDQHIEDLYNLELIEKVGTRKYILSKKYYSETGKKGEYTRRKGLAKHRNKELILQHLKNHNKGYMEEFIEIFSGDVPKPTINGWLRELKEENRIEFTGNPQIVKGENRGFWKLKNRQKATV